jgi:outer membrane usher protein
MALSAGISRGLPGSLGASLVHQSYWDGKAHQVGTVTYSQQFAGGFFMSLYSSYLHSSDSDFMVGLSFTKSLGERRSSSTTTTHQNDNTRVRLETQQNVPTGTGVGYRLGATLGDRDELDGSLHGQTDYGHYSLDARYFDEGAIWRAGARGSVAWLAGKAYLAREISRGFAVATVGDLEDVRVYLDNHEIGRTDEHGRILLPSLRPYETNRVRIEPEDLPLGMEVDALTLEISPYLGSGTVASFPVRVSRQAILYAMQPNGLPVPEGSTVQIVGDEGQSIAGVNGLIYLKGLQTSNRVRIAWGDEQCEFDIPLPEGEHPLPSLGTFVCEEAAVK